MSDDRVTLTCRHCNAGNRVPIERALADLAKVTCGRCSGHLLRVRGERLEDLRDEDLAHPWDAEALAAVRAVPMADKLLSKVMGATVDKMSRFRYLAGSVRITDKHVPELWALHVEAATRLDMEPPPLFLQQNPQLNAFAVGSGKPFIALTTGLVDTLEPRQLVAVLGHELTHIRLGHALYRTLALLLASGGVGLLDRVLGIGAILATPLKVALMRWYQMSELSADRGGLLAVASLDEHIRTEMALAGGSSRYGDKFSTGAFLEQADEAEAMRDSDMLLYALELLESNQRTHPLPAWRVHHVARWARKEAFFQILAGQPRKLLEDGGVNERGRS